MRNFLIFGASRGLGAALSVGVPQPGDMVWTVSRRQPRQPADSVQRQWIEGDLTQPQTGQQVADVLAGQRLDVLIYNAGIWEDSAFGSGYDFEEVPHAETHNIIAVNLTSAITCIQKVVPNLRQSANGKVILVGSTSGLENTNGPEVAYVASKFGLRGVAHALRENLRPFSISVTCINPGSIEGGGIPHSDLVAITRCLVGLSNATCVKEIDIPAMTDTFA